MRLTILLSLAGAASAFPSSLLELRQSLATITDQYLFTLTLPQFSAKWDAKDPPTLDWSSDGCSDSPDNPFGFPFLPACHRHDFGYRNYKAQNRFTDAARLKIDNNFKKEQVLYYQCSGVSAESVCDALADVYYAAVRAFGGSATSKRDDAEDLVREYEEKVAIYNELVKQAQEEGTLPRLDN